ncbi:hypothetical protein BD324DRAFT_639175 [Kockovaella imperatae]|uniref:DUF1479-domain-containing protein n=1 Tax=Kockovaella imperatae TaxID=4999 RepID=A0A1Y1U6R3_9TREE|nr:hypothetical protein BD324DRAFT_639175 [Kockovaella imperatae]ORX33692.1 hypothetical protein BD324DRAFT_639175 [Kockovaella imperatae]
MHSCSASLFLHLTISQADIPKSENLLKPDTMAAAVASPPNTNSAALARPQSSMSMSSMTSTARRERKEGDIGSVFASLAGEVEVELPERFKVLKREMIGNETNQAALLRSWSSLIQRLADVADEVERRKQDCIPTATYDELLNPSTQLIESIKRCGTVVVKDVVSEEQALTWLDDIKSYIRANPSVKGFPANDKQVFELYWSKSQLEARAHPRSLDIQRALLSIFSKSDSTPISLVPLTYADRLRIRHPGDAKFALGPHMDGGSVERWEDPAYRNVYEKILRGDWEEFDAWEMDSRATAVQNMYDGAGSCGVFRAFQGWTSLSDTGPSEGTLKVYPYIKEMTAYTILRPLFREKSPRHACSTHSAYLDASNWELDLESSTFPGSPLGRGHECNDKTHPHLQLNRTMTSLPRVRPGDQAWWHGDAIHAVESVHRGSRASSVMYIPSVPLTLTNLEYLAQQKETFLEGRPGPDFPGGEGESEFQGRGEESDLKTDEARRGMGFEPFKIDESMSEGEKLVRRQANAILGF